MDPQQQSDSSSATDSSGDADATSFSPLPVEGQPVPTPEVGNSDPYAQPGWSWGAFMLGPFFIIAVRKYVYLWLYLLLLVPIVGIFAWFGTMVFLGVKGRELAAASPTFASREEYIGFMKGMDHGGKIMFFVSLVFVAVWFFVVMMFMSSFSNEVRFMESQESAPNFEYDVNMSMKDEYAY